MKTQREMPFGEALQQPKFAPQCVVDAFTCYRDAVIWAWENRIRQGAGNQMDQAMCANIIGLHTPHMSRCVNRDASAPMNLNPDYVEPFEAFCGWRAVTQYMASKAQMTLMEQVLAERRAFA